MTTTGWLKTLDGADVYTEDGEWYWSHQAQGWFHAPGLLTSVPQPPLGTRVRDEVDRLTHGWPKWYYVFDAKYQYGIVNRLYWLFGMIALVYMWLWKYLVDFGPIFTGKAFAGFVVSVLPIYEQPGHEVPAWAANVTEEQRIAAIWTVLFLVISVGVIWYGLYINVVACFDPHKATAMLAAVVVPAWLAHAKRSRIAEMTEAVRRGGGP